MRNRVVWTVIAVVVALAVVVTAGTYVYIHYVEGDAPPPLSLDGPPTTSGGTGLPADAAATTGGPIAGMWTPAAGSQAGYRVREVLFGQSADAVGRTDKVTGTMTVDDTTVTAVDIGVDMASVRSDQDRRDNQFRGRIMDTSQYPTATFELTQPISLATVPADTTPVDVEATGDLTLHGVTRSVQVHLSARRNGAGIDVSGSIPVTFADYSIPNPSFGPARTEDHGTVEFLVVFQRPG